VDGGRGQLTETAVPPEEAAEYVDGFKTLVKLNPDHKESWEKNKEWLADIHERALKLGKPLFNETILIPEPGESKVAAARKLPEGVVKMAEDFGTFGHFYKTQVPVLWVQENGSVTRIASPRIIRQATEEMVRIVPRPMLLLSAAVDFEHYAAQYGIVSDLVAGPMCGRAYFKEAFVDSATTDWDSFEETFKRIALPRIAQIKGLAGKISPPWWHKFDYMSDEARGLIDLTEGKSAAAGKPRPADANASPDRY
jgi:tagatose-1,6-bisphosphate aldolase